MGEELVGEFDGTLGSCVGDGVANPGDLRVFDRHGEGESRVPARDRDLGIVLGCGEAGGHIHPGNGGGVGVGGEEGVVEDERSGSTSQAEHKEGRGKADGGHNSGDGCYFEGLTWSPAGIFK